MVHTLTRTNTHPLPMHPHAETQTQTHRHTYTHTHTQSTHANTNSTRTHTHTHPHTRAHDSRANTHTHTEKTHTTTHTHTDTRTHTHTHTQTDKAHQHTHTHARAHTHTHGLTLHSPLKLTLMLAVTLTDCAMLLRIASLSAMARSGKHLQPTGDTSPEIARPSGNGPKRLTALDSTGSCMVAICPNRSSRQGWDLHSITTPQNQMRAKAQSADSLALFVISRSHKVAQTTRKQQVCSGYVLPCRAAGLEHAQHQFVLQQLPGLIQGPRSQTALWGLYLRRQVWRPDGLCNIASSAEAINCSKPIC